MWIPRRHLIRVALKKPSSEPLQVDMQIRNHNEDYRSGVYEHCSRRTP